MAASSVPPSPSKAERRAARAAVGAYHEAELARLLEHVREGLARYDAGEIDAFELDDLIHHYKRATQKLWSFCSGGGSQIYSTAKTARVAARRGRAPELVGPGGAAPIAELTSRRGAVPELRLVQDRDQCRPAPVLLPQSREVGRERVELTGRLRRGVCARENARRGSVRAAVGSLKHLLDDALVHNKRIAGSISLPALGEPQPKINSERVRRSGLCRAPREFELVLAKQRVDIAA